MDVIQSHNIALSEEDEEFKINLPEIPDLRVDIPKENDSPPNSGPKLYVRDDGTVDWEGALQDRAALRKFGKAVWARINGQTPDELGDDEDDETEDKPGVENTHQPKAVTAKIEDTPEIKEARDQLLSLQNELRDKQKSHTALLNSGR